MLGAILAANMPAQTAFTEIINPRNQPGAGFGWDFGGLPDLTGDGVGEFYVVETSRVYVYDGVHLQPLYWIDSPGSDIGYPTHPAGDLNGDAVSELMLGKTSAGQVGQVVVVDGKTGAQLFTLDSPDAVGMGFFGHTLRLLPDMTGDGKEDWLIHQQEAGQSPPAGRVYIFNSQTREVVRTLRNTEVAYPILMNDAEVIPDVDGDGAPELLSGGNSRALVRSLETGNVLYELSRPDSTGVGFAKRGVGDIDGDGIGDIATGNHFADNNAGRIWLFSGADGRWLRTLRSPNPQPNGKFGWRIEALPDLNGDGVPELWTQEDEFNLTYVFDGATSVLLKTIEYPGPLGPAFFIGTVRQTVPPGIRAYLFASESIANSEGRVYYMPFTPISVPPPLQLQSLGLTSSGLRLQVTGRPGSTVEIQGSVDLQTWETLAAPTLADQPVGFEDSAAGQLPRRFYRARERQ